MKTFKKLKKRLSFVFYKLPNIIKCKIISTGKYTGNPSFIQPVQINGEGEIKFGENAVIGYNPSPFLYSGYSYIEARSEKSHIYIGNNVHINNNAIFISEGEGIYISDNTLIGTNCEIYDSDFHDLEIDKRRTGIPKTKKVFIGENVFIGSNVKILKGVTIGKNTVIAHGSIVVSSLPENVIAGGTPAKVLKGLDSI